MITRLLLFLALAGLRLLHAQPIADRQNGSATVEGYIAPNDSTEITVRHFDQSTLDELKRDAALNYAQPPTVAESLWDRFLSWLGQLVESFFEGATRTSLGNVLLYIVFIAVVVFIVMMLLRVDGLRVFYAGADSGGKAQMFEEDINTMNFEELIAQARASGNYRLGVRLLFLYALKQLADKHLIEWNAGKTNHDYVDELEPAELKTGLNELSFYFDYAWYGGFPVDGNIFSRVENIFNGLKSKVG